MGFISRWFAFRNGAGVGRRALVDADDHVQVDVLESTLPTGAATAANQLPDGHNVTVPGVALASNQLADGHNVTVPGVALAANQLADGHNVTVPGVASEATLASILSELEAEEVLQKTPVKKSADFTASQTDVALWDPTPGTKFVVTDYDLSFTTGGDFTMFDDSNTLANRVAKFTGVDGGGAVHPYRKPLESSTADNILRYTTGTGATGSITVSGYEI